MPRKYIHIKQLWARAPFSHSQLHFMVKLKEKQLMTACQIELGSRLVNASLNEYIQFQYDLEHIDELALYVIVIGENRVVNIGSVALSLRDNIQEKKQYLKGVAKQNGYLIYSTRDEPFPEQSILKSVFKNREKKKTMSQILTKNAVLPVLINSNMQDSKHSQQNEYSGKQFISSDISCRTISPQKRYHQNKGQDSQIDSFNTDSKREAQKIKSERHFGSSNTNKVSRYTQLYVNSRKCKKVKQKLAVHKQKNNRYNNQLQMLQIEFARQQQKIKQLGIANKI